MTAPTCWPATRHRQFSLNAHLGQQHSFSVAAIGAPRVRAREEACSTQ
ncbi:hypothetical protein QJS66_15810 [Kocuria rhizophila]|nr:hypothetical protein QJS66_15810 [Kocuria rhizophila]